MDSQRQRYVSYEFASQLPHDGGAFYTSGTAEASRPYYARSWPPLLLAVALWLTRGGGLESLNIAEAPTSSKEGTDPGADRFHLLFGICLQALCSTRTSEPLTSISTCVRALSTLLSSPRARSLLVTADSSALGVELCNVLHR
ncbi:hypothetical protein B566_EDAN016402 [Ephemera danica]|nr:hypothetical protein B566_EDAN016402 [Ephemera danica]